MPGDCDVALECDRAAAQQQPWGSDVRQWLGSTMEISRSCMLAVIEEDGLRKGSTKWQPVLGACGLLQLEPSQMCGLQCDQAVQTALTPHLRDSTAAPAEVKERCRGGR